MGSFFLNEEPKLEDQLKTYFSRLCETIPHSVKRKVDCLALGGSYGRGEGGIFEYESGQKALYNDLDLFLFTAEPSHKDLQQWVQKETQQGSQELQIDVDIKCLKPASLDLDYQSMFFCDLVHGHKIILGRDDYLTKYALKYKPNTISLEEATRLLWNRGSGLYFSACRIQEQKDKPFVIRNHQKLKLALGDAILCSTGNYATSCLVRAECMNSTPLDPELHFIKALHQEGVLFKIQPKIKASSWEELLRENSNLISCWEQVFLKIERKRLQKDFQDLTAYAQSKMRLMPQFPIWKCLAIALRDQLRRGGMLRPLYDYPRTSLWRCLAHMFMLLQQENASKMNPKTDISWARENLNTRNNWQKNIKKSKKNQNDSIEENRAQWHLMKQWLPLNFATHANRRSDQSDFNELTQYIESEYKRWWTYYS